MSEWIDIPIIYDGQEMVLKAELLHRGYIHGFEISLNEIPVLFEPDEERNYRVIIDETKYDKNKIDLGIIKGIIETLEGLK